MPNWCSNTLSVQTTNDSKAAKEQLKKFVADVKDNGERVTLKDAKVYREKFIADNFENIYRNDADKYVSHLGMPIKQFMEKVLYFLYEKDTKTFIKGQEDFSMSQIFPIPVEYTIEKGSANYNEKLHNQKALLKKYGSKDWYDWNVANWGTKWDVNDCYINEDDEDFVSYGFSSAWSPPTEFLKNICGKYPLLDFTLEFEEEGCDFEGELEIVAGKITKEEVRPFSNHSCNNCGDRQDDLAEGEKINDNGLCPICQKEEDEENEEV